MRSRTEGSPKGARPVGDAGGGCKACPGRGDDQDGWVGDVAGSHWVGEGTDERVVVDRKEVRANVEVCQAVGHQRAWVNNGKKEREEVERTGR